MRASFSIVLGAPVVFEPASCAGKAVSLGSGSSLGYVKDPSGLGSDSYFEALPLPYEDELRGIVDSILHIAVALVGEISCILLCRLKCSFPLLAIRDAGFPSGVAGRARPHWYW